MSKINDQVGGLTDLSYEDVTDTNQLICFKPESRNGSPKSDQQREEEIEEEKID